jgi:ATP-dependent helicase HrpB
VGSPAPLPLDAHLPAILAAVRSRGAAVVVAPPGAGKTTRVPPALAEDGPVIVLQPRRVAARALARRIASERGWTLGEEVGWQVRLERRFGPRTKVLVATEGILTARLQSDPLLSGFATAILDEFHERSLHADLALALAVQAARARPALRLVVMSATLGPWAEKVARFLGGAPVIEVTGRPHLVDVRHAPGLEVADAVRQVARGAAGHVLCFLPGAPEIRRVTSELASLEAEGSVRLRPLHGGLSAEAQDEAVGPAPGRKVVLATNIAETSLTIEGVTDVIDSGLHKVLRYDAARGFDRLETERIGQDSAEQRAGRAGRTGPGRALRLWDPREKLPAQRVPEIARVDLAAPLLDVIAWGGDPRAFEWFEAPAPEAVEAALGLLERLGALAGTRLTAVGEAMRRLPLPPRVARFLVAAGGSPEAAAACALLAERPPLPPPDTASASDVLTLLDRRRDWPPRVRSEAEDLAEAARRASLPFAEWTGAPEQVLRRSLLAGFPDRVARRREPASPRLLLASGTGAVLARESGVREGEWLLALDVAAGTGPEALVRLASRVDREWLVPTHRERAFWFDADAQAVKAVEREQLGALVLAERPVAPDAGEAQEALVRALEARGLGPDDESLLRRLRFAGLELDLDRARREACASRTALPVLDLRSALTADVRRALDRLAPESLDVPSGRQVPLEYREDGSVLASVKLQELFGLARTPRLGPKQEPVVFALLAPNGRPVQTTRDLRSFWETTYPEVRKELRGRYPKHPWPEDPWTAEPTARTKRR